MKDKNITKNLCIFVAIVILIVMVLASCTKYETIEIQIEKPNIELSTVRDILKPDLNTYSYWRGKSEPTGYQIMNIHAEVCETKEPPDYEILDSLSREFAFSDKKMRARWDQITYTINNAYLMCEDSIEAVNIKAYHDSIRLRNYEYGHFAEMVYFSIDFLK